jgi:TfuA protein
MLWGYILGSKRIIIFTGTSIHPDEARKILDADYRPPVGRGDVIEALKDKPDLIAIIDGVFHQRPAVAHKEILKAIKEGVTVVGGGSMGALRAAELEDFGMVGIGKVYRAYKGGVIEADDDVALVFNPETLEKLSEALISMMYNFKAAVREGIINEYDLKNLLKTAKSIYYPKRTYKKVLNEVDINESKKRMLQKFLDEKGTDVKREDALRVLEYIKTRSKQGEKE